MRYWKLFVAFQLVTAGYLFFFVGKAIYFGNIKVKTKTALIDIYLIDSPTVFWIAIALFFGAAIMLIFLTARLWAAFVRKE